MQFLAAVSFFNRPMTLLAARVPSSKLRLSILRNVWEEHGEGDLTQRHASTFLELLRRLGVSAEEVERRPLWPCVRAFDTLLMGACGVDEWRVGVATMGTIERLFIDVSCHLGQNLVKRGFLPAEQVLHYDLHETLDVRHSQDFFDVLAPSWEDEEHRYVIEQGLRMGAHAFDALYVGLYQARDRRWRSETPLRHVRR